MRMNKQKQWRQFYFLIGILIHSIMKIPNTQFHNDQKTESKEKAIRFSFFHLSNQKILTIVEYWLEQRRRNFPFINFRLLKQMMRGRELYCTDRCNNVTGSKRRKSNLNKGKNKLKFSHNRCRCDDKQSIKSRYCRDLLHFCVILHSCGWSSFFHSYISSLYPFLFLDITNSNHTKYYFKKKNWWKFNEPNIGFLLIFTLTFCGQGCHSTNLT